PTTGAGCRNRRSERWRPSAWNVDQRPDSRPAALFEVIGGRRNAYGSGGRQRKTACARACAARSLPPQRRHSRPVARLRTCRPRSAAFACVVRASLAQAYANGDAGEPCGSKVFGSSGMYSAWDTGPSRFEKFGGILPPVEIAPAIAPTAVLGYG